MIEPANLRPLGTLIAAALLIGSAARAQDGDDGSTDNGTDPSRVSSTASVYLERADLRVGGNSDTLMFQYIMPLSQQTKLTFKLPVVRNDTLGNSAYGRGDAALAVGGDGGLPHRAGLRRP